MTFRRNVGFTEHIKDWHFCIILSWAIINTKNNDANTLKSIIFFVLLKTMRAWRGGGGRLPVWGRMGWTILRGINQNILNTILFYVQCKGSGSEFLALVFNIVASRCGSAKKVTKDYLKYCRPNIRICDFQKYALLFF